MYTANILQVHWVQYQIVVHYEKRLPYMKLEDVEDCRSFAQYGVHK